MICINCIEISIVELTPFNPTVHLFDHMKFKLSVTWVIECQVSRGPNVE
jgi:hypothetical protein